MNNAKGKELLVLALAIHVGFFVLPKELQVLDIGRVFVGESTSAKDNVIVRESNRGGFTKNLVKSCWGHHGVQYAGATFCGFFCFCSI